MEKLKTFEWERIATISDEMIPLLNNREMFLMGMISDKTAAANIVLLRLLALYSHDPITIYFSSRGGLAQEGLGLYDTIIDLVNEGTPVHIITSGQICAIGLIILQAASKRIALPNTTFLYCKEAVDYITGAGELPDELDKQEPGFGVRAEERIKETLKKETIQELMNNILIDKVYSSDEYDSELFERVIIHNQWFDAELALKMGLIDEIKGHEEENNILEELGL